MKDKKGNFILDIVPLTKIPLTRGQSFSYLHDTALPAGTLVSTPLFHRKVEGIVLGSKKDFPRLGNIELKKIDKVIEEIFLTEKQLKLANFISDYYISPLGVVMKNFVPKQTKARTPSPQPSPDYGRGGKNIQLTKEQKNAVDLISNGNLKLKIKNLKFLLYGPSGSGKTEVYIHSILKLREKDKDLQFLILVPEQTLTPQAIERYGAYFNSGEIVVLSSNVSKGQYYSHWLKIRSGEARIVIGTRMAVFAPFKKLGLIVIDEEQDMSYKQWDMNPRYDARMAAEKLGELHECPVVRGTATPSAESYFRAIKKQYALIELPELKIKSNLQLVISNSENNKSQLPITSYHLRSIEIVDMRKEHWAKNYSCISKKLKSEIAYALKYNQQVILFINRQGMSSFSVCESCKTVLKCPKCERALVYDNSGNYRCVHCAYKTSITPECEKCRGITFKNVGLGTQKVEKEIRDIFPAARVARIDSQTIKTKGQHAKIYANMEHGEIDILIGTQMITKGWDLPRLALVGIIDTDNMLSFPDFRTKEKAYQMIVQAAGRTGRPGAKFPGTVVLQTYQPELKVFQWLSDRNFEAFFENEILERETFDYPPFGRIIKLVFQDYSSKRVSAETQRVYETLEKVKNAKISEPQDSFIPNIRGRHRKQIIIKFKKELPSELRKELKKLGQGWIIDVDPVSII
ncbi:MAG: primosomal protein N' [Candidatus Moranbacteria bacterium RIFOXYA2_FULL_43_15]|nr:MAG: primosomal protein N' [Candidatus Moranbacteria bacterium RIFOXYA2_FULL_43_15]